MVVLPLPAMVASRRAVASVGRHQLLSARDMLPGSPTPVSSLLRTCRIYTHATGYVTAARYEPTDWRNHQYAQELWILETAAQRWPIASSPSLEHADLVLLNTNFSLLCVAHKKYPARHVWQLLLNSSAICNGTALGRDLMGSYGNARCRARTAPKLVVLGDTECSPPWMGWAARFGPPSRPPEDFQFVTDRLSGKRAVRLNDGKKMASEFGTFVGPAMVARPAWLTGVGGGPKPPVWDARKLIFFAGHIPKLYLNKLRWNIYRQLASDPLTATCVSSTIACTVGAYEVCASPARISSEYRTFCRNGDIGQRFSCGRENGSSAPCGATRAAQLKIQCKAYAQESMSLPWSSSLLASIRRDARILPREEYLREALAHRFCIAAPGDMASTPKIAEFVGVGGARGCIPVIVLSRLGSTAMLPYSEWLDYCSFAFLVRYGTANRNMTKVVDRLRAVTSNEAAAMHDTLGAVREAFVWRPPSKDGPPSAADYVLATACHRAKARSPGDSGGWETSRRLNFDRCTL